MTRLQKKCLVAATGTHLLVVVAVLCSGFVTTKPKVDDSQVLDVIPANLIDAAFNSGVKGAKPPPPAPVVKPPEPQPQPQPQPEPPKPVVKPVEPVQQPEVEKPLDPVEPKPPKHEIKVDLKPIVRKPTPTVDNSAAEAEKAAKAAEKEAKRLHDQRVNAFKNAARSIRANASPSMSVDMPGDSTVAYANYASVVKSVYTQAWTPPDTADNDEANVKVSVTIANSGRVISARIVGPSGDASVDRSVQRTLDRVKDIAPFPDGATDKERTYIINFNLKAKRLLG